MRVVARARPREFTERQGPRGFVRGLRLQKAGAVGQRISDSVIHHPSCKMVDYAFRLIHPTNQISASDEALPP
jgi:hypothetical protein